MSNDSRYEICPHCRGEGSYVNPSIDGNGITESEMAELGDDFWEDYFSGTYDVRCEMCHGNRVIPKEDLQQVTDAFQQRNDDAQIAMAEQGIHRGHPDWRPSL